MGLDYIIKDYKITNSSTVSSSILNSSGESVSFILSNNLLLELGLSVVPFGLIALSDTGNYSNNKKKEENKKNKKK